MEVGLQVGGGYEDVLSAARWAEAEGFAAVALADHYVGGLGTDVTAAGDAFDGLIQLAGLARETSTIELSVLVSPITFRHPAVLAKSAVTIDHMSGGRFTLGVGTGWMEREHEIFGFEFPETSQRFAMMEEALAYLRAAFASTPTGYRGTYFQLQPISVQPKPIGMSHLVVGGTGNVKTPRMAGRYADEYNNFPASLDVFSGRLELMREAAIEAGRDPDAILVSSAGQVVTAPTRSQFVERFAERAAKLGMTVEELEAHYGRRHTPRGTHDEVLSRLESYAKVGVARFYLQRPADVDREADSVLAAEIRAL